MAGKHWHDTNGAEATFVATGGHRVPEVLGRWCEGSLDVLGWSFEAWYDGAILGVATTLARGEVDEEAIRLLGAARGARGRTEREALDDIGCALRTTPEIDVTKAALARRAVIEGFRSPGPVATWFGDSRALSRHLRRLYAETGGRRPPARSYALVLVDVNLSWLSAADKAAALASTAEQMHVRFPFSELVACLGGPRFGVVVRRHPGLAVGAESLHRALETEALLTGATKVLLVALPDAASDVGPFVRELSGAQRPLRVRAYEPRAAAGGGPGAELLRAAVAISAVGPTRRRRRLASVITEGSGMVAAALAVLVLAAGIGRAVGPVAIGGTPTTQLFGLAPLAPLDDAPASATPPVALTNPAAKVAPADPPPAESVVPVVPIAQRRTRPSAGPVRPQPLPPQAESAPVDIPAPPPESVPAPTATAPSPPPTTPPPAAPAPANEPPTSGRAADDDDRGRKGGCGGDDRDAKECREAVRSANEVSGSHDSDAREGRDEDGRHDRGDDDD